MGKTQPYGVKIQTGGFQINFKFKNRVVKNKLEISSAKNKFKGEKKKTRDKSK